MTTTTDRCVHLLIGDRALRGLLGALLREEGWAVEQHTTLASLLSAAGWVPGAVALVDWRKMEGLLAGEHRRNLALLTRQVPFVVLVPGSWERLTSAADLGVAALLPKPFDVEGLLLALEGASMQPVGRTNGGLLSAQAQ